MIEALLQQYLVPGLQFIAALFTPAEWKAFFLLVCVTMAVTQIAKVGWRVLPIPADRLTYKAPVLYLIACVASAVVAKPLWPEGFSWWVAGVIGGPASAVSFKLIFALFRKFAPDLAAGFNADRRRNNFPPPGGIERRKKWTDTE